MKKNVQYGLIFGGVVIGSYIVVKIVQNISDAIKAKKNEDEALKVIEEVASTGTTTNVKQLKYSKIFALAKNDSSFTITEFALADDEIDYTLYNPTDPSGSPFYREAI